MTIFDVGGLRAINELLFPLIGEISQPAVCHLVQNLAYWVRNVDLENFRIKEEFNVQVSRFALMRGTQPETLPLDDSRSERREVGGAQVFSY